MNKERVPLVGVLCVLVPLVLAGCGGGGGASPSGVVDRFFALSSRGQTQQAQDCLASQGQGLGFSYSSWGAITNMVGVRLIRTAIDGVQVSGDEATVRYHLQYNPSVYDSSGQVQLVKENGQWKILEFR